VTKQLEVDTSIRSDRVGVSIIVSFVTGKSLLVCARGAQSLTGTSLVIEIGFWIISLATIDTPEDEGDTCEKDCATNSTHDTANDLLGRSG